MNIWYSTSRCLIWLTVKSPPAHLLTSWLSIGLAYLHAHPFIPVYCIPERQERCAWWTAKLALCGQQLHCPLYHPENLLTLIYYKVAIFATIKIYINDIEKYFRSKSTMKMAAQAIVVISFVCVIFRDIGTGEMSDGWNDLLNSFKSFQISLFDRSHTSTAY